MATGLGLKASYLVELMLAGVGQRGSIDLQWHWFETIYGLIREQPWPWNWKDTRFRTFAPIVSTETYTWTAGDSYIQGSGALTFDHTHTGRFLEIDNIPFMVTIVDTALNRLHLDAPVGTTVAVGVLMTLYRANLTLKTGMIKTVEVDGTRLFSTTDNFWRRSGGQQHVAYSSGLPEEYEVSEEKFIPEPLYAPIVNGAPAGGNIEDGTYEYFWTAYDPECNRHSKPGPSTRHTYTGGPRSQSWGYDGSVANIKENESYQLILWRSEASPTGSRYPAYKVGFKDPRDAASFVTDSLSAKQLIGQERYYDGPQVDILWHMWPDALYTVYARHINNYGGRPSPNDMIPLGKQNVVTELLPMGASTYITLSNRGISEQHQAIVKFRQQLAYLIRKDKTANAADPGLEEINVLDGVPNNEGQYDPTMTYTFRY